MLRTDSLILLSRNVEGVTTCALVVRSMLETTNTQETPVNRVVDNCADVFKINCELSPKGKTFSAVALESELAR